MALRAGSFIVSNGSALQAVLAFDAACLDNYDFGPHGPPDRVDVTDIGRLIGSRMVGMSALEAAQLIHLGTTAPWHTVPLDARIEDAAPGTQLFASATALRAHFEAARGIKAAKATKLLAQKRPALFPIIDERISWLYTEASAALGAVPYPTMVAIRLDILRAATASALMVLRNSLILNGSPKALRLAQLPGLRLRDIVLWQRWQIVGAPSKMPKWPTTVPW